PQTDARGLRVMHVRVVGKVCSYTGAIKGLLHGRPGLAGKAAYRDGAVRAVKLITEIGIVLQFLEIGQHPFVGPLRVAAGRPGTKTLRCATNKSLAIDRAGPPGDLATWHGHGMGLVRIRRPCQGPVVGGPGLPYFQIDGTPAIFQHIRQLLWVREVWSGFQEEHAAARVLGQAGRPNAARGSAPHFNGDAAPSLSFPLSSSY